MAHYVVLADAVQVRVAVLAPYRGSPQTRPTACPKAVRAGVADQALCTPVTGFDRPGGPDPIKYTQLSKAAAESNLTHLR